MRPAPVQAVGAAGPRHHLVDHGFGLRRRSWSTMWLTLMALRDVVDEEQQPPHAGDRQQHGAHHGEDRRERVRQ